MYQCLTADTYMLLVILGIDVLTCHPKYTMVFSLMSVLFSVVRRSGGTPKLAKPQQDK